MRPLIIGDKLVRTFHFADSHVIGDVHFGDRSLQMRQLITKLKRETPDLQYFDESSSAR